MAGLVAGVFGVVWAAGSGISPDHSLPHSIAGVSGVSVSGVSGSGVSVSAGASFSVSAGVSSLELGSSSVSSA